MGTFLLGGALVALAATGPGPSYGNAEASLLAFAASGLILAAMAQASFSRGASSLRRRSRGGAAATAALRLLSPTELVAIDGIACGLVAGMAVMLAISPYLPVGAAQPLHFMAHAAGACLTFALLGILSAMRAPGTARLRALNGWVLPPCILLASVLHPPADLPLHLVDGFRYGVTGHAGGASVAGLVVAAGTISALIVVCSRLLASGRWPDVVQAVRPAAAMDREAGRV